MCCLRSHNGHDIEEKRFLTVGDIVAGKETVSEAAGRGYQAVDGTAQVLHDFYSRASDHLQDESFRKFFHHNLILSNLQTTRNILHAFEVIAGEMQVEQLSSHSELEERIKMARDISQKLEQLQNSAKDFADDSFAKFKDIVDQFANSVADHAVTEAVPRLVEPNGQSDMSAVDNNTDSQRRATSPTVRRNIPRDVQR
ncbi:hypothetical protein OESDEN_24445 [Oesophagostomum dentatum]|uniref:Uncharacterized protein n=1 Tax=Oesophagostomum dentatum TaxID=61180 RepID=A0A0B1RWC1_OESDE|nr:hypothetical protein OESDEN_24445 [Oesophagostomum dentatum]